MDNLQWFWHHGHNHIVAISAQNDNSLCILQIGYQQNKWFTHGPNSVMVSILCTQL